MNCIPYDPQKIKALDDIRWINNKNTKANNLNKEQSGKNLMTEYL